jgi:small subunit ribosomal protein S9
MAEEARSLEDLKSALQDAGSDIATPEAPEEEVLVEPKIDEHGRAYGTGKPQERRRPRLDQAGLRQDHRQRP